MIFARLASAHWCDKKTEINAKLSFPNDTKAKLPKCASNTTIRGMSLDLINRPNI